jgi:hypothetical protein
MPSPSTTTSGSPGSPKCPDPLPFAAYPGGGRSLLGVPRGDVCRRGYGLDFIRRTGQRACAYCSLNFTLEFEHWLVVVDHVVPTSVCKELGIPVAWREDCANKVVACSACNGYRNRYRPSVPPVPPQTLEEFLDLRDRIFAERREPILTARAEEAGFFASRPWDR